MSSGLGTFASLLSRNEAEERTGPADPVLAATDAMAFTVRDFLPEVMSFLRALLPDISRAGAAAAVDSGPAALLSTSSLMHAPSLTLASQGSQILGPAMSFRLPMGGIGPVVSRRVLGHSGSIGRGGSGQSPGRSTPQRRRSGTSGTTLLGNRFEVKESLFDELNIAIEVQHSCSSLIIKAQNVQRPVQGLPYRIVRSLVLNESYMIRRSMALWAEMMHLTIQSRGFVHTEVYTLTGSVQEGSGVVQPGSNLWASGSSSEALNEIKRRVTTLATFLDGKGVAWDLSAYCSPRPLLTAALLTSFQARARARQFRMTLRSQSEIKEARLGAITAASSVQLMNNISDLANSLRLYEGPNGSLFTLRQGPDSNPGSDEDSDDPEENHVEQLLLHVPNLAGLSVSEVNPAPAVLSSACRALPRRMVLTLEHPLLAPPPAVAAPDGLPYADTGPLGASVPPALAPRAREACGALQPRGPGRHGR